MTDPTRTPAEREAHLQAEARRLRRAGASGLLSVGEMRLVLTPLAVRGVGDLWLAHHAGGGHDDDHPAAVAALDALLAGPRPHLPLVMMLWDHSVTPDWVAQGRRTVVLRTARDWRALVDAWARSRVDTHSRVLLAIERWFGRVAIVDGEAPVTGPSGTVLTGDDALTAREAALATLAAEAAQLQTTWSTALAAVTLPDPAALPASVGEARRILLDRLDDAAVEMRRWLLDDDLGGAGPATVGQEAALRLLEARRQAGRRSLRAAATVAALRTASTSAESLVRGVGIEDAPAWRLGTGSAISGGRQAFTWSAPKAGRWSQGLRAVNPAPAVAGKSPADLGAVVLDDVDAPDGWTVADGPRPAPAAHERAVTVTAPETPAAGVYEITLTARNACGPSKLVAAVTVPAAG